MIIDIAIISLTMSVIILFLIIFSDLFGKRYKAKYRYIAWLILSLRLLIPLRFDLVNAPISFEEPDVLSQPIINGSFDDSTPPSSYYEANGKIYDEAEIYVPVEKHAEGENKTIVLSLSQTLTVIWAIGAVLFMLYHFIILFIFNSKIKKSLIRIKDNIYKTPLIESPMMTGFFRNLILIPDVELSDRELELILLHENAHAQRGDMWYKLLLVIANAVHWFNPIIYLMTRHACRDLEYSCDDIVTKDMSADEKKEYSLTLLRFMHKNKHKKEDKT